MVEAAGQHDRGAGRGDEHRPAAPRRVGGEPGEHDDHDEQEGRGRQLVRRLERAFSFKPETGSTKQGRVTIDLDRSWTATNLGVVAFLMGSPAKPNCTVEPVPIKFSR